jgi:hypothetical protein
MRQHFASESIRRCAERHSNSDFSRLFPNDRRHEPMEPDRREKKRRSSEHRHEQSAHARLSEWLVEQSIHRLRVPEAQLGLNGVEIGLQRRENAGERPGRLYRKVELPEIGLTPRDVRLQHRLAYRADARIVRDADDRAPIARGCAEPIVRALADRIFVRPHALGQRVAYDDDLLTFLIIGIGEPATSDDRKLERLEIVGISALDGDVRIGRVVRRRAPFWIEPAHEHAGPEERRNDGWRDGNDSWNCTPTLHHLLAEGDDLRSRVVLLRRPRCRKKREMIGVVAEVDVLESRETSREQNTAGEHHERERRL